MRTKTLPTFLEKKEVTDDHLTNVLDPPQKEGSVFSHNLPLSTNMDEITLKPSLTSDPIPLLLATLNTQRLHKQPRKISMIGPTLMGAASKLPASQRISSPQGLNPKQ